MASNYIPLPKLLKAWSRQSGELESDILINLGEHAAAGTLEFGALRRPDGPTVKSHGLTILTQQMRLSGYDSVREGCAELLESLVVSKYRIISFCDRTSTKPPRCALGLLKWLLWRDYRHSAPPPHLPESDETPNLKESARISSPSYTSEGASIPAPDHPERREHADELGDQAASEPFSERPPADAISVNAPPDVAAAPKPVGAGEDKKESNQTKRATDHAMARDERTCKEAVLAYPVNTLTHNM